MRKHCANRYWRQFQMGIFPCSFLCCVYFFLHVKEKIDFENLTENPQDIRQNLNPQPKHNGDNTFESSVLVTYNLMEDYYGRHWAKKQERYNLLNKCTLEYANAHKLQQDHPCVLQLIKAHFLRNPVHRKIPYNLNNPEIMDPSDGQSTGILRLLRNQTNGFFIECGSYDGEFLSNTLYMERSLNWTGLLVEPDREAFHHLTTRNRKAYLAPLCLSTQPYPMQVLYNRTAPLLGSIVEQMDEKKKKLGKSNVIHDFSSFNETDIIYKTQCFPLYSILLAVGKTEIDYFGLDVEGSEYKILNTIPWHKVDIKSMTVEWNHTPEGEIAITRLLKKNKFVKFGHIEMLYSSEVVYVKDFLYDLRQYENVADATK